METELVQTLTTNFEAHARQTESDLAPVFRTP